MSDYRQSTGAGQAVQFFVPAVAGWAGRLDSQNGKQGSTCSVSRAAPLGKEFQQGGGLWEEAAFAALGVSGAAAILAAFI